MNITVDTACGREIRMRSKDVMQSEWWPVVACCWNCVEIIKARNSWMEVYA